jgi:two-component system, OmpR family, response regulator MprA
MADVPPPTILVVDDDPAIIELITFALEREGAVIVGAVDGREAIEALGQRPTPQQFCLVLLDLMMPRVDGLLVLRYLQHHPGPTPPVVVMTAHPALLQDALAAGARGALRKPFGVDELLAVVRSYCSSAQK